jgi:predicted dehydrogenase
MPNIAGIGVGARGQSNITGISDADVAIARPQRSSTGLAYTPEQLAQQAARGAQRGGEPGAKQPPQEARKPRKLANIYALCDVDTEFAAHVFKGYPKAKVYSDWREMLQKEKSIDAVVISTPDHAHATIAAAFMREKKHIYVEKPICKTVLEARKLAELAKQYDVVTQMGNQGHATEGTRQTVEWIQSGLIGLVREVHLSTNRPIWPQGNLPRPPEMPVPPTLNYEVWLGPAPMKPYNPECTHFNWRGLWDYGTGAMGDMGAHIFDAPIWALNLGLPKKIQASSSPHSSEYLPQATIITYEFAGRGYMPPVKVTWCDGGLRPSRPETLEPGRAIRDATYYGDKGIIMHASHGAVPELVPADPGFKGVEPWLPRTSDIYEDWVNAIRNGKKSCNDFSIASKVTEIMLLANIALLTKSANTTLEYDAANMRITNLEAANKYLHYEYRQGWSL